MATMTVRKRPSKVRGTPNPAPVRLLRRGRLRSRVHSASRVETLLAETLAFMDSPIFKQKNIEKELFDFDHEPELPPHQLVSADSG